MQFTRLLKKTDVLSTLNAILRQTGVIANASILSSSVWKVPGPKSSTQFFPLTRVLSINRMTRPGFPSLPHRPPIWFKFDGSARPIMKTSRTQLQFWPIPRANVHAIIRNLPAAKSHIRVSLSTGPVDAWKRRANPLRPFLAWEGIPRAWWRTFNTARVWFCVPD